MSSDDDNTGTESINVLTQRQPQEPFQGTYKWEKVYKKKDCPKGGKIPPPFESAQLLLQ